jgi:hypothetical protein
MNLQHTWFYCGLCQSKTVICGNCGNNCCNGGYGQVDGVDCTYCSEAYELQDLYGDDISTFLPRYTPISLPLLDQSLLEQIFKFRNPPK